MLPDRNPEYFLTIAKEKSISRAAELLRISQPYLSQYVIRLENAFGLQLLDREKKPIALTEAGEIYAKYLRNCEEQHKKLLLDFAKLNTSREQTLRIAFSSWRASTLMPSVLPIFIAEYPHIRLVLDERPTSLLYQVVLDQKADFAIMNVGEEVPKEITAETIYYEKIFLVGNRENPTTQRLLELETNDVHEALSLLKNERIILLRPDIILAKRVKRYLDEMQMTFNRVAYTTNATTAMSLTAGNYGFCFTHETAISKAPDRQNLAFFNLNSDTLVHPLCAVYRKDSPLLPTARAFIETAAEFYQKTSCQNVYDRAFGPQE